MSVIEQGLHHLDFHYKPKYGEITSFCMQLCVGVHWQEAKNI